MAISRGPWALLVVGVSALPTFAACGDSAADGEPESGDTTGQALTSTSTGHGSSTTLGATSTTGQAAPTTATATGIGASTTGGGAGGGFSDTTGGGEAGSTTGSAGPSGAGGTTGSVSATTTSNGMSSSTMGPGSSTGASAGGSATEGGPGGGTTTDGGTNECEFSGNVSYQFNQPAGWPADVVELLTSAMDEAMYYYNCYADFSKELTINYDPGVPTAQGNTDGWISFGSDRNYMQVATAMHEVGHTMGVGYSPWAELMDDGTWTGPAVVEFMTNLPAAERDPDMYSQRSYVTGDSQHFWPYGLNQASEHQSEWSLINHVRIVAAMQLDKQAYLAGDL